MGRKNQKKCLWMKILEEDKTPPDTTPWTEEEELRLESLKNRDISISDTALDRLKKVWERELEESFASMDDDKQNAFLDKLKSIQNRASI